MAEATKTSEKVQIYRASDGWRWRFLSKGGRVLADGGQGYADKRDCIRGLLWVTGGSYERLIQIRTQGGMYQQGRLTCLRGNAYNSILTETYVEVIP